LHHHVQVINKDSIGSELRRYITLWNIFGLTSSKAVQRSIECAVHTFRLLLEPPIKTSLQTLIHKRWRLHSLWHQFSTNGQTDKQKCMLQYWRNTSTLHKP